MERHLRRCADYQTVIFVPIGDADVRLDVRLLYFWYFIFCLKNFICFSETFFNVANVNADFCGKILFRVGICKVDILWLIVNLS